MTEDIVWDTISQQQISDNMNEKEHVCPTFTETQSNHGKSLGSAGPGQLLFAKPGLVPGK